MYIKLKSIYSTSSINRHKAQKNLAMTTQNQILENAREMGLNTIEITTGMNGYPQGLGDYGVTGFETYADAEKFAEDNGGEVVLFESKYGWHFWNQRGWMSRPFNSDDLLQDMGDNYAYADTTNEHYAEQLADIAKDFDGDFEALENRIKEIKEIIDAVESAYEDERVIVGYGNFYETVKATFMAYNYDTHRWAVGVLITNDNDIKEDEE